MSYRGQCMLLIYRKRKNRESRWEMLSIFNDFELGRRNHAVKVECDA